MYFFYSESAIRYVNQNKAKKMFSNCSICLISLTGGPWIYKLCLEI